MPKRNSPKENLPIEYPFREVIGIYWNRLRVFLLVVLGNVLFWLFVICLFERTWVALGVLVVLLAIVFIGWFLMRSFVYPIFELMKEMKFGPSLPRELISMVKNTILMLADKMARWRK